MNNMQKNASAAFAGADCTRRKGCLSEVPWKIAALAAKKQISFQNTNLHLLKKHDPLQKSE